ncbi:AAA family ATPase [Fundidesulfovibrio terrae]|uniref:AAA family ATPase n=1 Tax=Fundidesulfovibrio terrae TaxID=2922866 RepID=UPI001FAF28E6|nr:AAA family ATPase [Fundidesulfovibrio terrae]
MRYFELLNLRREPFSNSPDPDLFYRTKQHRECLQALEIALRLKRGLCVVTGHVGTGKTTLCRQLIRLLGERQGVVTHLVLDPSFSDAREFLVYLCGCFGMDGGEARAASDWQLREHIKNTLWGLAVEEDQLVALIVDEGQKMSLECLEILRELLNFETNEHKLLQIVIFGQLEFEPILEAKANLADRVNLRFRIGPLDFQDTRELIQARLAMCSKDISPEGLFSFWALLAVYLATDGFPRQIVQLCHQALLAVIIKERPRVTWGVVRSCMRWRTLGLPRRRRWPRTAAAVLALLVLAAGAGMYFGGDSLDLRRLKGAVAGISLPDVASWFRPDRDKGAAQGGAGATTADSSAGGGAVSGPGTPPKPAPQAQDASQQDALAGDSRGVSGPVTPSASGQQDQQGQPGNAAQTGAPAQESAAALSSQLGQPGGPASEAAMQPSGEPSGAKSPREQGPPRFTGVRLSAVDGVETLEILTDYPVDRFESGFKPNPARILVDLPGNWERRADRELPVGSERIDKVRSAVHPDKLRVAVYLKDASVGPVRPQVEKTPSGLRVILK